MKVVRPFSAPTEQLNVRYDPPKQAFMQCVQTARIHQNSKPLDGTYSALERNETRLERNETRLERNETRLERNETRLERNETRLEREKRDASRETMVTSLWAVLYSVILTICTSVHIVNGKIKYTWYMYISLILKFISFF